MGGLWWFNDALTLGFTMFVAAAAIGAIIGRPFVVQRLTALGLVLPVVLIVLNLIRYLWALRATTGSSYALALAALRVNLSLSWVIALACFRGLTQERGVFLRTPKFAGAATIRELRLVWAETAVGIAATTLLLLVLAKAGFAPVGLVLAGLLAWVILIYGSAPAFALSDPARAPIGDVLGRKMALELAPRIGRVVWSKPARLGSLAAVLVLFGLVALAVSESGRAPVAELPLQDVPAGPLPGGFLGIPPAATIAPTATSQGSSTQPGSTGSFPAGSIPPGSATTGSPAASAGSGSSSALPSPSPVPTRTLPVIVPTPTPRHSLPPTPAHTPPRPGPT
jgi:hypothetical protein